ncbi:hypothetical protein JQW92_07710 [Sulfitobacter pseudonitzschiae]|uniref:hypothetical protein n=2 Tax=Pseudosulfitobacter pseudonitzschiae TaxID=1402135 RepID=UPI001BB51F11|nr:hypothetical protein [Pseudosulfitobacter pseudonitzschiae]MBM1814949.1 hypothetical protein [Pseudosulfitobacter pseudonitzschiae]MBM1836808.1 hypothetical protein [Pseudosulfitobacter pseudonitzschiae]MBM1841654.1 hypothetical protein [Pseudosulfitobacter pseudonitzschiae]MBM1846522.1 hypothetical protein [Pseudosulfitobacter pseudonitzschiae]MBM1861062.1 hypothetical protein [Pseudosulfitobacter pseudonitzschiae]
MMRAFACLALIAALAACDPGASSNAAQGTPTDRQQPSVTEPGVHVSGYAKVGVVKTF